MKWQDIQGWFSEGDAQFVRKICSGVKNGVVVELGFFGGRCTAVMAPICKANNVIYHAIDNCVGDDIRDPATKMQRKRDMKKVFEDNMKQLHLLDYLHTHVVDSTASATMFGDESVDFCFVDASHTSDGVKRDINAWWPKIKHGGVLGGHDYRWPSVRIVLDTLVKENNLSLVAKDNCWKITK